jgi:hypothetical protein
MAADLETSLRRDARLYAAARAEIGAVVGAVGSGRLGLLLRKRYLLFEGWGKIAGDMGYSAKYVFELHRLALAEAEAAREKVKDLTSPYLDMWYDI